ncbi:MAG: hypothetical protein KJ771_05205 [Nanoarchaeota archaeon]|nr:hypothetical protein [Nanoarchaeota archaeon]
MALCACFLNQYKDQLSFYTLDEQDFLKNKSELESQIKNLVIETVNVNVENIVI